MNKQFIDLHNEYFDSNMSIYKLIKKAYKLGQKSIVEDKYRVVEDARLHRYDIETVEDSYKVASFWYSLNEGVNKDQAEKHAYKHCDMLNGDLDE